MLLYQDYLHDTAGTGITWGLTMKQLEQTAGFSLPLHLPGFHLLEPQVLSRPYGFDPLQVTAHGDGSPEIEDVS